VLTKDQERQAAPSQKLPLHAQLPEDIVDEVPVHSQEDRYAIMHRDKYSKMALMTLSSCRAQYKLKYIAKLIIGLDGGVHQIEGAIKRVLELVKPDENPEVCIENDVSCTRI
jgi:hypothetical protein